MLYCWLFLESNETKESQLRVGLRSNHSKTSYGKIGNNSKIQIIRFDLEITRTSMWQEIKEKDLTMLDIKRKQFRLLGDMI